jgi:hypothetical protein
MRSPDDRVRQLTALKTAYVIWTDRSETSRDAAHASKVLRAMLKKVSGLPVMPLTPVAVAGMDVIMPDTMAYRMQTLNMAPAPPLTQPILATGGGTGSFSAQPMETDYPIDFVDFTPLDDVLTDPEKLDWVSKRTLNDDRSVKLTWG